MTKPDSDWLGVFKVKDRVTKVGGYRFPGIIVSAFETTRGQERYVVECTVPEVYGMLHIFSADDLTLDLGKADT